MCLNVIWGGGLLFGPYFIRNRPYNSDEYMRLLGEEVFPDIQGRIGDAAWNMATWMQDGARLHTSHDAMAFLDAYFGPRILSDKAIRGQPWAPNSPDLSPCDFFLHGHMKANIYRGIPPTLAQLEVAAENFFDDMNSHHGETIKRAVLNMKKRARACLQNLGGTFEGKKWRQ